MKKHKYQHFEEIATGMFIHHNALDNSFLLMSEDKHHRYTDCSVDELKETDIKLYQELINGGFLIEDAVDETLTVDKRLENMMFDTAMYQVVVNTTLDCNLKCWYCYEDRIPNSILTAEVIETIKKNIAQRYSVEPFSILKVSFFGGEPFMDYGGIQSILDFSKKFCKERDVELIADFTTNATLITPEIIQYLKEFRCHFQITLDGGRETHNKIKVSRTEKMDTYQRVIDVLRMIDSEIGSRCIAVRINFDNKTLRVIDEIINDISFLERTKSFVILKKVWQIDADKVDRELLMEAIQKLFNERFLVDYYLMPKGCICFAQRQNQVLFNYDGKIFKCTTLPAFDTANELGVANKETGEVIWHKDKIAHWMEDIQTDYCKACHWFPSCLGICNRQLIAHGKEKICTFDASSLTQKEYLMYLFKYHKLQNELYEPA